MFGLIINSIGLGILTLVDLAIIPMSLCFLLGHGDNVSFPKKDFVISNILVVLSNIVLTIITVLKILEAKNIAIGSVEIITIVVTIFATIAAFILGILLINKRCNKNKIESDEFLIYKYRKTMTISMIVARGKNNEIGGNNTLLWHLPSDLKFFKEKTMGKCVIMGRNTFQSLPKALPGRKNIVMSHDANFSAPEAIVVTDILSALKEVDTDEVFIIGGASIYKAFLPITDKLYITEIDFSSDDADVFFPEIDLSEWNQTLLDEGEENELKYKHFLYERKNKGENI